MLRRLAVLMSCCLIFGMTRAEEVKPLKALLVCGGCCHDYKNQKDILKKGLEERAYVVVDIIYSSDGTTKPPIEIYGNPDYAKNYDVVIHDECSSSISDPAVIAGVLKPHKDGIPGVNLHCAMHCYRIGNPGQIADPGSERAAWFDYLGLQSSGHGPQEPIAIAYTDKDHAISKGMEDWVTVKEELYNNVKVGTCHALASGKQTVHNKDKEGKITDKDVTTVVVWTNEYSDKKTRVFSTTIGHNNQTVSDPRYLDLVTRGLLWACDKPFEKYMKPKTDTPPAPTK